MTEIKLKKTPAPKLKWVQEGTPMPKQIQTPVSQKFICKARCPPKIKFKPDVPNKSKFKALCPPQKTNSKRKGGYESADSSK